MEFLFFIAMLFFVAIAVFAINIEVGYSTHRKMTKDNSDTWGFGSFKDFLREFKKIKWRQDLRFDCCFQDKPDAPFYSKKDSNVHASIIKFSGKGMVMANIFEYRKFQTWEKNQIKSQKMNVQSANWSEEKK